MTRRSRRWSVLAVATLLYVTFMTFFGGCANQLLLYPSTQPIEPGTATRHTIERDGRTIEYFRALSPGAIQAGSPKAYVLEFTGNASRAEEMTAYVAGRWGERPVEVWVMNYPGFGGSSGPATLDSIAPSALVTYDDLAKRAAGKPIILAGNSLGTAAALYIAANRKTVGMVMENPPPLQRMILQRHGWWNLYLLAGAVAANIPKELNSLELAPKVKVPAVFMLAKLDRTVPPKYQQLVVDAYGGEKRTITLAGGHNDGIADDEDVQLQKDLDWLWSKFAD